MESINAQDVEKAQEEAGFLREMMASKGWKIYQDHIEARYHDELKRLIVEDENEQSMKIKMKIRVIAEFQLWPGKILEEVEEAVKKVQEQEAEGESPAT